MFCIRDVVLEERRARVERSNSIKACAGIVCAGGCAQGEQTAASFYFSLRTSRLIFF